MNDTPTAVPIHLAIIMDGNRRWAKEQGLPVSEGHRRVASAVLEKLVERAAQRGIAYITFWAFSTENWDRSPEEVKGIMTILRTSIGIFGKRMHEKNVKMRMIGDISRFDTGLQKAIQEVSTLTAQNTRITVTLALNYGGRDELLRAIHKIKDPQTVTQDSLAGLLDTAGIPDPDFIVRTGGEQRLSGFLLWQSEYSELYFPSWYMPEFTPERLDEVLEEFNSRKRRFGK